MNTETTPNTATTVDFAALWQVARILIPAGLTTALFDFLFWDGYLGASVGVFFAGVGLLLFLQHRSRPRLRTWLIALLLAATSLQSAIALSLSNLIAAGALTLALAGDVFQPQLTALWARVSEALFGLITAPFRWMGLGATAARGLSSVRAGTPDLSARAVFLMKMLLPSLALLAVFGAIFATGHAVFGDLLKRADNTLFNFWLHLDITPLRVASWALVATAALGLFHGMRAPESPRWWTRLLPRIPRADARLATWQTALALLAVNALFCMVNTLDAIFLWAQSTPPAGINASEFLHSGVNNLIIAVILSAAIIAGMFQQSDAIASNRWLKALAHLWGLQNFVLLAGVLRRLMFYTDAYHLTEKRVYVGCFLALVAVGFVLLAWFVQKRHSFNWLLGRNALATFALFFALQFADVAGWVAHVNVARWEQGKSLDIDYLANLGPTAWPELIHVARSPRNASTAAAAQNHLKALISEYRPIDWRAYQWQRDQGYRQLFTYLANP